MAPLTDGGYSLETGSRPYRRRGEALSGLAEVLLLLGAGALVVVLHQTLRMPLHLPGRQGLQWMAILLTARSFSRNRVAGGVSSAGAAATAVLPVWGFDDPFVWLTFLAPGLVIDAVWARFPGLTRRAWFLGALGGVALVTKPLIRFGIEIISGVHYSSLALGLAYPVMTHLLFGVAGGLVAGGLLKVWRNCERRGDR